MSYKCSFEYSDTLNEPWTVPEALNIIRFLIIIVKIWKEVINPAYGTQLYTATFVKTQGGGGDTFPLLTFVQYLRCTQTFCRIVLSAEGTNKKGSVMKLVFFSYKKANKQKSPTTSRETLRFQNFKP